jgi:hypothetical protein
MFAMGPMEIVMLLALGSSGASGDLTTLISPQDYFKRRGIEMSIDRMAELAGKDPVDGKAQLAQLLALRVLGEKASEVKKSPRLAEHKTLLEAIAGGKKFQDRLGFSREYAAWALSQVTGTPARTEARPKSSVREETLQWFPVNVSLVAAVDFRQGNRPLSPQPPASVQAAAAAFIKTIGSDERDDFYKAAEGLGNARVERQSLAIAQDPNTGKARFFLRFTGKADHERLVGFLRKMGVNVHERKGPQGTRISSVNDKGDGPVLAFIGDTDFLVVSSLDDVLAVRAGKQGSVLAGPLSDELSKISDQAVGFVVGAVPEEAAKGMTRPGQPFRAVPQTLFIELLSRDGGYDLRFRGQLDNAENARSFSEAIKDLRAKGLEQLKNVPNDVPVPVEPIRKSIESLRIETQGNGVTGEMRLSREAVMALPLALFIRSPAASGSKSPERPLP